MNIKSITKKSVTALWILVKEINTKSVKNPCPSDVRHRWVMLDRHEKQRQPVEELDTVDGWHPHVQEDPEQDGERHFLEQRR